MMSRPSSWPTATLLAAGIALALVTPPAPRARAQAGWVGTRVVETDGGFRRQIGAPAIDPRSINIYRVGQVIGPWLSLEAEGISLSGWAPADQVIPVDQAIAFFTDYIRANPGDPHGYTMRAIIRREE